MVRNAEVAADIEMARRGSLKQLVYEEMKRKIITCEIMPGAQLTEEAICEMLKASRTPVRDALSRLEQEQLLSIHSKKGIFINTVSLSNVNELFEARMRIEPYAVEHYGNRIRDEVYVDYINFFAEQRDPLALYERDDQFHQLFISAAHNRYLSNFYNVTKDQVMRYRVLSDVQNRTAISSKEHREVALQCLRGNWSQAAEAMRVHIENSKISIIHYVLNNHKSARNIFSDIPVLDDDLS